ncbi:hypothetical protein Tco_0943139 [Tanacetum coccineum]
MGNVDRNAHVYFRHYGHVMSASVGLVRVYSGEIIIDMINLIIEYLVNISKRRAFWSLNEDILKINDSDNQYAISIKEDTAYPCCTLPKDYQRNEDSIRVSREIFNYAAS